MSKLITIADALAGELGAFSGAIPVEHLDAFIRDVEWSDGPPMKKDWSFRRVLTGESIEVWWGGLYIRTFTWREVAENAGRKLVINTSDIKKAYLLEW